MFAAILTTVLFSLSAVFAIRSIRAVGQMRANIGRLIVAVLALGSYAHIWGTGTSGAGRDWFLLSGLVGMGLGDVAVFAALRSLGSRLTLLMAQCLAVPCAMLAEWLWLGTRIGFAELLWCALILAGVIVALVPSPRDPPKVQVRPIGFVWGVFAALGQGIGAVLSRKGYDLATAAGESPDGLTTAYQRVLGGLAITLLWFASQALYRRFRKADREPLPPSRLSSRGIGWIIANATAGAILGVSCYQWALGTTPSGLVLPIVATTPLVVIPLAWWLDGDRPTTRAVLGGLMAVGSVVGLILVQG